jgi:hypothetical protein
MKKLFQRRFPTYLTGLLLGLLGLVVIMQVKRVTEPDFADIPFHPQDTLRIAPGGSVRLKLGNEPGRVLVWGFPTRLAMGREQGGRVEPVIQLEYKDLAEPETLIGPIRQAGDYQIIGQFYICDYPGEKYCGRVQLSQSVKVSPGADAPKEAGLEIPLKEMAESAAKAGANSAQSRNK